MNTQRAEGINGGGHPTAARSKSPWFAFYPADYEQGTKLMSLSARGAYVSLLCHQFDMGSIPSDDRALCRIIGAFPDEWDPIKGEVLAKFQDQGDGTMVNPRMAKERAIREEIRDRRIDSGKRGAASRWNGKTK